MSVYKTTSDPYTIHRSAILPLISEDTQQAFNSVKTTGSKSDEEPLLSFILQHGLAPLWHETLKKGNATSFFSPTFTYTLKKATLTSTAQYLRQQHSLKKIGHVFSADSIPHAVFKGAHIRELIYSNPAVRPSCDIDILVSKEDKVQVIKALSGAGLTFHPIAENISHEVSLNDGYAFIDLHWDLLRPGRTRIDLTNELLATRKKFPDHWGLSNEATLFIMLVHPVFAKYGTAPQAALVRIVDLVRWIQTRQIDWNRVLDWLERGSVQTAAWITSQWLDMLTGVTLPESFVHSIKPSAARSFYLKKWLSSNLSSRLLDYPPLILAGFTLPAHDTLMDGFHAFKSVVHEKRSAEMKLEKLMTKIDL